MHDSMISKDGDISIKLKSKEVTWFNFLEYSRVANSVFGGWNNKSYWIKKGLKILSESNFIQEWTSNSFNNYPEPRRNNFMFNREPSDRREDIVNKDVDKIDILSENDINTFLFFNKNDSFSDYKLIGYEIPLVNEKDGQLKIDLLSLDIKDNKIGIIELKQSNSPTNSPLLALVELFCYGIQLLNCKTYISKEKIKKYDMFIE